MNAIFISLLRATLMLMLSLGFQTASALTIFSAGMQLPESISLAPDNFGDYGGSYIVPDFRAGKILAVSPNGEKVTKLAEVNSPLNGTFLANGEYVVAGYDNNFEGALFKVYPNGNVTPFVTNSEYPSKILFFATPAVAPSSFGDHNGALFATGQLVEFDDVWNVISAENGVFEIKDGSYSPFVTGFDANPWGMTFAPEAFGSVAGKMLVGTTVRDPQTFQAVLGEIYVIDADGTVEKFAEIPIFPSEGFLAQLGFAPSGFPDFGDMLFASVAGRSGGGGSLGALLVLDKLGDIVYELKLGTATDKFDPRGVYFRDNDMLVSDGADPIWLALPSDFGPATPRGQIPEPATLILMSIGLAGLGFMRRRRT